MSVGIYLFNLKTVSDILDHPVSNIILYIYTKALCLADLNIVCVNTRCFRKVIGHVGNNMKFYRCQDKAFVSFQVNFHGILIKDTNLMAISVSSCNDIWSTLGDVKGE